MPHEDNSIDIQVKPTLEETETVIRRIAPIQKTFWGEMWSVFAVDEEGDIQDSAFSNVPIPPHNDCTYFTDAPR